MNEIKAVNAELDSSIHRLELLKNQEWDKVRVATYSMLEDPCNDEMYKDKIEAHLLSINVINMIIELAKNGIDLLGDLNNKDIGIKTIVD